MGRRFRVLLVGHGARGRSWRKELSSHPSLEATAVVDPNPAALTEVLNEGLVARPLLSDGLSVPGLDAALIASPPGSHVRDAVTCVRAGLAVLVEKPLATTSEDAAFVAQEGRVSGRPVLVAQTFRFLPREAAVRSVLEGAGLGDILRAEVGSARPAQPPRRWDVGPLWDFVLHHLDALRVRVGRVPDEVRAHRRGDGVRDLWEISLRWAEGPSISYRHLEGGRYRYRERIVTSAGRLVLGDRGVRFRRRHRRPRWVPAPRVRTERLVLDELVRAIRGSGSGLEASDNVGTVALVEAVERSVRDGRAVPVRWPDPD